MKLGLSVFNPGKRIELPMDQIRQAEQLGFDSIWIGEAYGSDAVSAAAWILAQTSRIKVGTAIMQMPARTPAMAAMTAMTLNQLSDGRFIIGLGASGPQVVEGWHGVPYGKPLTRTREYIAIMRKIMAREGPVEFHGELYDIPLTGPGTTGLGKPLKSIMEGDPSTPIYTANITPAGLACAAEVADGVLPLWQSPEKFPVIGDSLQEGFAKVGSGKSLADFDVAPVVQVMIGDDLAACRQSVKDFLALYVGGMGARGKNFYNDYATAMGYGEAAAEIQNLYLAGKKAEAANAVPDAFVDEIALVGPAERIRERAQDWKKAGERREIGTLIIRTSQAKAVPLMAECFL